MEIPIRGNRLHTLHFADVIPSEEEKNALYILRMLKEKYEY